MVKLTKTELSKVIKLHRMWVERKAKGERVYPKGVDLSGANLSKADLRGTVGLPNEYSSLSRY